MWRGQSCTLIGKQFITLADGATKKECAVILVHGLYLFQSLRFVDTKDLTCDK
jgi:Tfp pilus assembly protein PilN